MPRPRKRPRDQRTGFVLRSRTVFYMGTDWFKHYRLPDGNVDYEALRYLWFQYRDELIASYHEWNNCAGVYRRQLPGQPGKPDPMPWAFYEFEGKQRRNLDDQQ